MLANELKHRVKNSLAMVDAIAARTFRNATSLEGARQTFSARIQSMSRAQDLLTADVKTAAMVEDANGYIVGSCESVGAAMALWTPAAREVGILDFRLPDGEVTPVAVRLLDARVPVVLHTASPLPAELLARTPHLAHCPKLAAPEALLRTLHRLLGLDGRGAQLH